MQISPVNMDARKKLDMRTGDTVRVMQKIEEKGKTRLQPFEGLILAMKHGKENGATFTVRRVANGFGVEKIFPLYSPMIESIEVTKRSKVSKSKLYHIRETALKQISKRMKMLFVSIKEEKDSPAPDSGEGTESQSETAEVTEEEVKTEEGTIEAPAEAEEANSPSSDDSGEVKEEEKK